MLAEEYKKLCEVELNHWFYKGKRTIALAWIKKLVGINKTSRLIDIGAGTGIFVKQAREYYSALGIEPSPEGIALTQTNKLVAGSILDLPIKTESFDIATSMDVLEHIENHRKAIEEIIRVVRKEGVIFITVPAGSWAMSDWDVSLGHFRRYDMIHMDQLLKGLPIQIIQKTYINSIAFFPVVIYRALRKLGLFSKTQRLEDVIPPDILNKILFNTFVWPAMIPWLRLPFGLSIMVILKKI